MRTVSNHTQYLRKRKYRWTIEIQIPQVSFLFSKTNRDDIQRSFLEKAPHSLMLPCARYVAEFSACMKSSFQPRFTIGPCLLSSAGFVLQGPPAEHPSTSSGQASTIL